MHPIDNQPDDILIVEELAAYQQIRKSTLYKHVRESKIPYQKIDRYRRFRNEAIDRWLEKGGN